MSPTQRQMDALRFIRGYQLAKGYSPCIREIMAGLGSVSRGGVHYTLRCLKADRAIKWVPHRARAIEVLTDIPVPRDPDGTPLYFVRVP